VTKIFPTEMVIAARAITISVGINFAQDFQSIPLCWLEYGIVYGIRCEASDPMFIKRNRVVVNGRVYEYGFLVRSVNTDKGPRHEVLYALGRFDGIDRERDKKLALDLERMLCGQQTIQGADPIVKELFAKLRPVKRKTRSTEKAERERLDEIVALVAEAQSNASGGGLLLPAVISEHSSATATIAPEVVEVEGLPPDWVEVNTKFMAFKDAREAGPVYVGHQFWDKLGLSEILEQAGLTAEERKLSEVLTLNRLIEPTSEHATPDWVSRTALCDLIGEDIDRLNYRELYGNLDKLHPKRQLIERELFECEKTLFNLDNTLFLYDLTSTYMEGRCSKNEAAKHGYSRDSRSDCRQVVIGLMLNRDGFPIGHEVFEGNTVDCKTVEHMVNEFETRTGGQKVATIVVDRGMSDKGNLEFIRSRGHHYIVAAKQTERQHWLAEFENQEGWHEVIRKSSSISPARMGTGIRVKRFERGEEMFILCLSEGRVDKDRAIRAKQEERLVRDLKKLQKRVEDGSLKTTKKVYESIGRIRERYPRVGRYYQIDFNEQVGQLVWQEIADKKANAEKVDGGYILRTTRKELTDDEIWQTYMLLTRVESAFKDLKSPLAMRPIYHQLKHRTEAHIFICVLAYHLLVSIEHTLRSAGITESWETIRKQLSTHQTVSGLFITRAGRILETRRDTVANLSQRRIYAALGIESQIIKQPLRRWVL
jgi:transposase